jgi:hypothetical protein
MKEKSGLFVAARRVQNTPTCPMLTLHGSMNENSVLFVDVYCVYQQTFPALGICTPRQSAFPASRKTA